MSVTTETIVKGPTNFSAYQIPNSGESMIALQYSFFRNSSSGMMNMTPSLSRVILSNDSQGPLVLGCGGLYDGQIVDCGVDVIPVSLTLKYYPGYNASFSYRINLELNSTTEGEELIFYPGGTFSCSASFYLIIGNEIPSRLGGVFGSFGNPSPALTCNISVIGDDNMTGLEIPQ